MMQLNTILVGSRGSEESFEDMTTHLQTVINRPTDPEKAAKFDADLERAQSLISQLKAG